MSRAAAEKPTPLSVRGVSVPEEACTPLSFFEEPEYESTLYWLWLADVLGYASPHAGRVLDAFGGARGAYEARFARTFAEAAGRAAAARARDADNTPARFASCLAYCRSHGIAVLPFEDPDYPLALARIPDPPLVLYCTGDTAWLNGQKTVGMVGSRIPSPYGRSAAAVIGKGLAESGAVIVSGLADGLDSESHRAAVEAGAPTIGVLGVSIDRTYPASNYALRRKIEAHGAVLSEYPPFSGGESCKSWFLQRNRIIAALSLVLLVVEAKLKSGTMSTVGHAERYGRPVYAVPGSIFSDRSGGTNALLREGRAKAAVCPGDLYDVLGLTAPRPQPEAPPRPPLSETARRVLACVGATPCALEAIAEQCGLPAPTLLSTLMQLELAGYVSVQPGRRYVLK